MSTVVRHSLSQFVESHQRARSVAGVLNEGRDAIADGLRGGARYGSYSGGSEACYGYPEAACPAGGPGGGGPRPV